MIRLPLEFEIKGQGDEYVDLSQTNVQLLCKFTKDNGNNLTGDISVSTPVNNIVHSLFSEIDLSLNGKVINPGTATYPYKAYLDKLLLRAQHPQYPNESMHSVAERYP